MKAVILAGGYGTRISEESSVRPKPMVEIGARPILWHIMKGYAAHDVTDFVICAGYKGYLIKEYFWTYHLRMSDMRFDLRDNQVSVTSLRNYFEPWQITVIDTGEETMTGGRLKRVREFIGDETFCFTYGDAVSDIDITRLVEFHRESGGLATMTVIQPPGRFGTVQLASDQTLIEAFREKPAGDGGWINGGYFVLEPAAIDYIADDTTVWERAPLERLANEGKLAAYRHRGFWQNMDTLRDKMVLEEHWATGKPPWKIWENGDPA